MKVSELTVEEFTELIRVHTYMATNEALLDLFGDPDQELLLKEEVSRQLRESVDAVKLGKEPLLTLSEVMGRRRSE